MTDDSDRAAELIQRAFAYPHAIVGRLMPGGSLDNEACAAIGVSHENIFAVSTDHREVTRIPFASIKDVSLRDAKTVVLKLALGAPVVVEFGEDIAELAGSIRALSGRTLVAERVRVEADASIAASVTVGDTCSWNTSTSHGPGSAPSDETVGGVLNRLQALIRV